MPYKGTGKAHRKRPAQRAYDAQPHEKKKRANRNRIRAKLQKEGRVSKGDGKHVHHKNGNAMDNSPSNVAVVSASKNMADNKGKGGRKKISKK